jgi:hypothetical protein
MIYCEETGTCILVRESSRSSDAFERQQHRQDTQNRVIFSGWLCYFVGVVIRDNDRRPLVAQSASALCHALPSHTAL